MGEKGFRHQSSNEVYARRILEIFTYPISYNRWLMQSEEGRYQNDVQQSIKLLLKILKPLYYNNIL